MKGGGKKSQAAPTSDDGPAVSQDHDVFLLGEAVNPVDGEELEDEGVEGVEGVIAGEREEEVDHEYEAPQASEPPKLEEGFYEIEDIRKKRVQKGELQYLIKWRGWPETANTWEPLENLRSCADFIEVFEEKQRPRGRKRRRKNSGLNNTFIKRKPRSVRNEEIALPFEKEHREGEDAELEEGKQAVQGANENGALDIDEPKKESSKETGNISIQLNGTGEEDGSMEDGTSKVEFSHPVGSKKRKSGSVRRFKKDSLHDNHDEAHNAVNVGEKLENEGVDSNENEDEDGNRANKLDDSAKPPTITKILKPVRYHAFVTDDVQQVSITFKALSSDGHEVLVDDKDLKLNNPLLLISYYEQHLRCSPLS